MTAAKKKERPSVGLPERKKGGGRGANKCCTDLRKKKREGREGELHISSFCEGRGFSAKKGGKNGLTAAGPSNLVHKGRKGKRSVKKGDGRTSQSHTELGLVGKGQQWTSIRKGRGKGRPSPESKSPCKKEFSHGEKGGKSTY